jgi:hypothetical protein
MGGARSGGGGSGSGRPGNADRAAAGALSRERGGCACSGRGVSGRALMKGRMQRGCWWHGGSRSAPARDPIGEGRGAQAARRRVEGQQYGDAGPIEIRWEGVVYCNRLVPLSASITNLAQLLASCHRAQLAATAAGGRRCTQQAVRSRAGAPAAAASLQAGGWGLLDALSWHRGAWPVQASEQWGSHCWWAGHLPGQLAGTRDGKGTHSRMTPAGRQARSSTHPPGVCHSHMQTQTLTGASA